MGLFSKKDNKDYYRKNKKVRWALFVIFVVALLALFFDYPMIWNKSVDVVNRTFKTEFLPHFVNRDFKLGLDLQGGTHLVYEADLSNIDSVEYGNSMQGVKDVIERRINMFGVAEPIIQINNAGDSYRLIVELAGISDVHQAIEMIGQTPSLDFRTERDPAEAEQILADQEAVYNKFQQGDELSADEQTLLMQDPYFIASALTGRFLKGSELQFDQQTGQAYVGLEFDSEGSDMFAELTRDNVGKRLAIYLDGAAISAPVVQEAITGGKAQISGNFSVTEAKELVQRLNAGALPVPINLINQQTIGASLGHVSLSRSLQAGILGFIVLLAFLIFYYRLPGVMAALALIVYIILLLALFKLIPVTLTLAGIAGIILSIGMAVDANVLIFERMKEELKAGKSLGGSIEEGLQRAWPAIRDGNISTLITSLILFIFATGLVKGFALTLGIGVIVSMLSAIVITRTFLRYFVGGRLENVKRLWY